MKPKYNIGDKVVKLKPGYKSYIGGVIVAIIRDVSLDKTLEEEESEFFYVLGFEHPPKGVYWAKLSNVTFKEFYKVSEDLEIIEEMSLEKTVLGLYQHFYAIDENEIDEIEYSNLLDKTIAEINNELNKNENV